MTREDKYQRYTSKEVIELLGISRDELASITREDRALKGLFTPRWQGIGKGSRDFYSKEDIQVLQGYYSIKKRLKEYMDQMRKHNKQ